MTNTRFLEGIRCPECGQDERFHIEALITCFVTDNEIDSGDDTDWNDENYCCCVECLCDGPVKSFKQQPESPPKPPKPPPPPLNRRPNPPLAKSRRVSSYSARLVSSVRSFRGTSHC